MQPRARASACGRCLSTAWRACSTDVGLTHTQALDGGAAAEKFAADLKALQKRVLRRLGAPVDARSAGDIVQAHVHALEALGVEWEFVNFAMAATHHAEALGAAAAVTTWPPTTNKYMITKADLAAIKSGLNEPKPFSNTPLTDIYVKGNGDLAKTATVTEVVMSVLLGGCELLACPLHPAPY